MGLREAGTALVEKHHFRVEPVNPRRVPTVRTHHAMHHIARTLSGLMVAAVLTQSAHAGTPPEGPVLDAVQLTAWLHVEDLTMEGAIVELEVGGAVQRTTVQENGRFQVSLPSDVEAVLRFSKPGHLTKEVVVDTRHVNDGGFDGKKRHVDFAVILELERHMAGHVYPGPVGSLGFDEQGGCLTVEHDRRKVPAERRLIMVF